MAFPIAVRLPRGLIGLRRLTPGLVVKRADSASIAGVGWPNAMERNKASAALDCDGDHAAFANAKDLHAPSRRSDGL